MNVSRSFSYSQTPHNFNGIHATVPQKMEENARTRPAKEAFVIYGLHGERHSVTCLELYNKSVEFARGLLKLGVVKGDIICISLPNSSEWLFAAFGSQIAGAIPLGLDMYDKGGSDVIAIIQKTGKCKAVICDVGYEEEKRKIFQAIMENPDGNITKPEFIILTDAGKLAGYEMDFNSIMEKRCASHHCDEFPSLTYNDIALIQLTSGTTGASKLVQLSHIYIIVSGYQESKVLNVSSDDIFYNSAPFGWSGGFPMCSLYTGSTHVTCHHLLLASHKDLVSFTKTIWQNERCTGAELLPQMILKMLDSNDNNDRFQKLRVLMTSGIPVPANCCNVLGRFADNFVNLYGTTELSILLYMSVSSPADFERHLVGRPVVGTEVKIVSEDGNIVHAGIVGELYARRSFIFSGYLNEPEKTKFIHADDGWCKTGDAGYMRKDGKFLIIGRISDDFKYSGDLIDDMVSPYILEDYIREICEGIEDVCVVSVMNPYGINRACVCVLPMNNTELCVEDIKSVVRSHELKIHEILEIDIIIVDDLPKLSSGKVARKQLRNQASKVLFPMGDSS